jgi:transposase
VEGEKESHKDRKLIAIAVGYSKDHRPDMMQAVVALITSQASSLPVWLEALDGNSTDVITPCYTRLLPLAPVD